MVCNARLRGHVQWPSLELGEWERADDPLLVLVLRTYQCCTQGEKNCSGSKNRIPPTIYELFGIFGIVFFLARPKL